MLVRWSCFIDLSKILKIINLNASATGCVKYLVKAGNPPLLLVVKLAQ
jgi:hypothetical protein